MPPTQMPVQLLIMHLGNEELHLDDLDQRFWDQEDLLNVGYQKEEHRHARIVTETHFHIKGGSYVVQIPF